MTPTKPRVRPNPFMWAVRWSRFRTKWGVLIWVPSCVALPHLAAGPRGGQPVCWVPSQPFQKTAPDFDSCAKMHSIVAYTTKRAIGNPQHYTPENTRFGDCGGVYTPWLRYTVKHSTAYRLQMRPVTAPSLGSSCHVFNWAANGSTKPTLSDGASSVKDRYAHNSAQWHQGVLVMHSVPKTQLVCVREVSRTHTTTPSNASSLMGGGVCCTRSQMISDNVNKAKPCSIVRYTRHGLQGPSLSANLSNYARVINISLGHQQKPEHWSYIMVWDVALSNAARK